MEDVKEDELFEDKDGVFSAALFEPTDPPIAHQKFAYKTR